MTAKHIKAQVESIKPLTDSILQIILAPNEYIDYQAGQYLQIISNNEAFSFSIANAPLGSHKYELHLRHSKDNAFTTTLLAEIKEYGEVTISVPLGHCHLNQLHLEKPIVFIAAGTGFAPIKAMIEQLLAESDARTFELFWGARSQSDLYMDEMVTHWQTHVRHFQYFSQLSQVRKESLADLVLRRHEADLKRWQFVLGGPFEMVYKTRDLLVEHGVHTDDLFSDAFHFETQTSKDS